MSCSGNKVVAVMKMDAVMNLVAAIKVVGTKAEGLQDKAEGMV